MELLRNALEAGAGRIFVAFSLRRRRYRTLTVIDDGPGVPADFGDLIFEPGVTSRHLEPSANSGLSLHHIRQVATNIQLKSPSNPTAITATFDTRELPERTLQSTSRPSSSNIPATLQNFHASKPNPPRIHYGKPSQILATLIHNHIIQTRGSEGSKVDLEAGVSRALGLGLTVSERTARRVLLGQVGIASEVEVTGVERGPNSGEGLGGGGEGIVGGVELWLSVEEIEEIAVILRRAAGARFLEVGPLRAESRGGSLNLRVRVTEPEEEYE